MLYRKRGQTQVLRLEKGSGENHETVELTVSGRINVDDYTAMIELVAAGQGIGLMPELHVAEAEKTDRLVRIFPEWVLPAPPIHLVYSTRQLPERVRLLIDFLCESQALSTLTRGGATGSSSPRARETSRHLQSTQTVWRSFGWFSRGSRGPDFPLRVGTFRPPAKSNRTAVSSSVDRPLVGTQPGSLTRGLADAPDLELLKERPIGAVPRRTVLIATSAPTAVGANR